MKKSTRKDKHKRRRTVDRPIKAIHEADCLQCAIPRMDFEDKTARDVWSSDHADKFGHTVRLGVHYVRG